MQAMRRWELTIAIDPDEGGSRYYARRYQEIVKRQGVTLDIREDAVAEIARIAALVNARMENIGARRLHTVMTTLLEDTLFELPDGKGDNGRAIVMDGNAVRNRLKAIVEDEDLRRYIL